MDYGIRWDSGSGKSSLSLSLSKHDTSSFHHVRRRGEGRREEERDQGRVWYPSTHIARHHPTLRRARWFKSVFTLSCLLYPYHPAAESSGLAKVSRRNPYSCQRWLYDAHSNLDPGDAIDKALVARLLALLRNCDILNVIDKVDDL